MRLNAVALGMTDTFEQVIKNKIIYYNSQPENEKMARLQSNITDVKDQMIDNLGINSPLKDMQDKIIDRED